MTRNGYVVDEVDARILRALIADPRSTLVGLADVTGLARNTVQSRVARLESSGVLQTFERRIDPAAIGFPLTAFITVTVTQRKLDSISASLADVPEVIEVYGLSGATDLLVRIAARDADDLYRIAGRILDIEGIEKTSTGLAMRELVEYRVQPLLDVAFRR